MTFSIKWNLFKWIWYLITWKSFIFGMISQNCFTFYLNFNDIYQFFSRFFKYANMNGQNQSKLEKIAVKQQQASYSCMICSIYCDIVWIFIMIIDENQKTTKTNSQSIRVWNSLICILPLMLVVEFQLLYMHALLATRKLAVESPGFVCSNRSCTRRLEKLLNLSN